MTTSLRVRTADEYQIDHQRSGPAFGFRSNAHASYGVGVRSHANRVDQDVELDLDGNSAASVRLSAAAVAETSLTHLGSALEALQRDLRDLGSEAGEIAPYSILPANARPLAETHSNELELCVRYFAPSGSEIVHSGMKPHVQRRALAAVAEREELHVMTIERLGWLTVSRALFFYRRCRFRALPRRLSCHESVLMAHDGSCIRRLQGALAASLERAFVDKAELVELTEQMHDLLSRSRQRETMVTRSPSPSPLSLLSLGQRGVCVRFSESRCRRTHSREAHRRTGANP